MTGISPGTLLIGAAVAAATREGAVSFDFLRGSEPYKYRWGAIDRPTLTLRLPAAPVAARPAACG